MKNLLIAEMIRAVELLKAKEKPFDYNWENRGEAAELKRLMLSIRKHSVQMEKEAKNQWSR